MTPAEQQAARSALWQAMIGIAEELNDAVVLEQRKALPRAARRIRRKALRLASLAHAIVLLSKEAR